MDDLLENVIQVWRDGITCMLTIFVCMWCKRQDLKDFMRQAGEVTYADAHKEHKNEGLVMC